MRKVVISAPKLPPLAELVSSIEKIWQRNWVTNDGPVLRSFESNLSQFVGSDYVSATCNGHAAIEVVMRSLGIQGQVITTPYTFVSTGLAVRNVGAEPVFADIAQDGPNIDPERVASLVNSKTSAILAVHAYGLPCDVQALEDIAVRHNIPLIYDAAHAFGTEFRGRPIARFGRASIYSFHATKLFHSIEGGAICTQDRDLFEAISRVRNFGITGPDAIAGEGTNAKMNEIMAAVGELNLMSVSDEIEARSRIDSQYRTAFSEVEGFHCLEINSDVKWNFAYFPIFLQKDCPVSPDELENLLRDKDIISRRYFNIPLNNIDVFRNCPGSDQCRNAEALSQGVLCLPIHGGMTDEDSARVIDAVTQAFK